MIKQNGLFLLLALTACFQYDSVPYSGSGSDSSIPYTGYDPLGLSAERAYSYYPSYDPGADNPYIGYQPIDKYKYPKYDPNADNPYYPPSTYAPPPKINPEAYKYNSNPKYNYRYPKYDQNADNPIVPNNTLFDRPLFEN